MYKNTGWPVRVDWTKCIQLVSFVCLVFVLNISHCCTQQKKKRRRTGRFLLVSPPPVFVVGRLHRTVRDGSVDFHLDFGRGRHFGGESLSAVRRRHRQGRRGAAAAAAARTGIALAARRVGATAVAVARRRLHHHFRLDDNLVGGRPRRRLLRDGRQRQVRAAQPARDIRHRRIVVVVVIVVAVASAFRLGAESGSTRVVVSPGTAFHARRRQWRRSGDPIFSAGRNNLFEETKQTF